MKRIVVVAIGMAFMGATPLLGTSKQSADQLKSLIKAADVEDEAVRNRAARLVQDSFDQYYFASPLDEANVTGMIKQYQKKYRRSPFVLVPAQEVPDVDQLRRDLRDRQDELERVQRALARERRRAQEADQRARNAAALQQAGPNN